MARKEYIDYLLSLKKSSQFAPFEIEWVPLYGIQKETRWLQTEDTDFYGYDEEDSILPGPQFKDLVNRLLPSIEEYPYTWPINGQKLDREGYDFSTTTTEIEIEPVAYIEALRQLKIPGILPGVEKDYMEDKRVTGGHLTKFSLTFEKAGPLSTLSFQMFSQNPVHLVSLVSERDLNGSSEPIEVNLDALQIQQESDTVTLLFGEPIFSKRLTFVLAQNAALSNQYYITQEGEDFTYQPVASDRENLKGMISKHHHGQTFLTDDIYSDAEISDWSEERRTAYTNWRNKVERGGI